MREESKILKMLAAVMFLFCLMLMAIGAVHRTWAQTPVPATPAPLPNMTRGDLPLLRALAGLKITLHAGAAANTNIAIAGITTADSILSVLQAVGDVNEPTKFADRTSETWISGAGTIKLTTTSTAAGQIMVYWYDHDAYSLGQ